MDVHLFDHADGSVEILPEEVSYKLNECLELLRRKDGRTFVWESKNQCKSMQINGNQCKEYTYSERDVGYFEKSVCKNFYFKDCPFTTKKKFLLIEKCRKHNQSYQQIKISSRQTK